jgi:quercetin dioxygenase-like cupin family protein
MLRRRAFASCAICGVLGLVATGAGAQAPITRTVIRQEALPGDRFVSIQALIEIAPGAEVARHTHPGHESSYMAEGEAELVVDGQPPRILRPGDSFLVQAGVPHAAKNGPRPTKLFGTFVVEKDKPLASPA